MAKFLAAHFFLFLALLLGPTFSEAAETDIGNQAWSASAAADYSSDSDTIVSDKESLQSE